MTDPNESESPLDAAAGATGPRATEAFSALGNETRLSILLALWEGFDPFAEENAMSFSELRERVGMRDSGQFNYHLDQLTGQFIRATDSGYELRKSGQKLVRTVIAGTGIGEMDLPPTELDLSCNRCGSHPVEISYEAESLHLKCVECEGFALFRDFPTGTLAVWHLAPAGLADRDPAELLVASAVAENNRGQTMIQGVCPDCSGSVETTLQICEQHRPGSQEVCPNCGTRDSARVRYVCAVCKNWNAFPVQTAIHNHPAVISFYYSHGIDITYNIGDLEKFHETWEHLWKQEHAVVSTDPVQIRVTVPCEGDELHVLLNDDVDVIDVKEQTEMHERD